MVNTLDRHARDVTSIPALGAIFPIFIIRHDTGSHDEDSVKLSTVFVEPALCMYVYIYICMVTDCYL